MSTFSEFWSATPRERRTDRAKVLVGLAVARAFSPNMSVSTTELGKKLRLHLRGNMPKNITDVLRKAVPDVEATVDADGLLRWWITWPGMQKLNDLTGLSVDISSVRDNASVSLGDLHPVIRDSARQLFVNGHYAEAVGASMKHLNMLVRQRTGRASDTGVGMMQQVFATDSNGHTRLVLGPVPHKEDWQRDKQSGFRFLMAGIQEHIANVHKHGHLDITTPVEALELLSTLSFLARKVTSAEKVEP